MMDAASATMSVRDCKPISSVVVEDATPFVDVQVEYVIS